MDSLVDLEKKINSELTTKIKSHLMNIIVTHKEENFINVSIQKF